MLHLENLLIYDVPPIVAAISAVAAAKLGAHNKQKLEVINKAVNDVGDPNIPSIKEDVKAIRDAVEDTKK